MRVAASDLRIGGSHVRQGDSVTLWNVSANRDETEFDSPDVFDISRSPNRHLSYGVGIHRCIGAIVAHTELGILFRRMTAPGLNVSLSAPVQRLRSNFIQGITRMPITLH
jgi:cytochrome P450